MKLLFFVLVLAGVQFNRIKADPLLVTVYYESLCPDSMRFIVNQLEPTISKLENYVQLKLVPFGKANSVISVPPHFQCQHGPSECQGNIVQDCTINYMERSGRTDSDIVKYVSCEMKSQAGSKKNFHCVQKAYVPVESIKQCVDSTEGVQLQMTSEVLTKRVHPSFVPTITVNDVYNDEIQNQSLVDLRGTLCRFLPGAKPCLRSL